jgi:hypothetical protein
MKKFSLIFLILIASTLQNCGVYSFTGTNLHPDVKTVQVDYFPNHAVLVEPTLSTLFTVALQDRFLTQTNLELEKSGGDLQFEGEITGYKISPMTATAEQTAAQNRITITVNVRFYNNKLEEDNFERSFSFYYDFPAEQSLSGSLLVEAYTSILDRITQDIFNASVAKW